MVRAATKSRGYVGVRSSILVFSAVLVPLLAQPACGSEDNKKKSQGPRYQSGGEGGGDLGSGGSSSPGEDAGAGGSSGNGGAGGAGGAAGSGGTAATAGTGMGGEGAAPTDGGSTGSGVGGESGGGNGGPQCEPGKADCDDDPTTCERDVTSLAECGDCNVSCSQANGTTICGETGCEVTSCTADYGDCNETGTDGCEELLTTADNCGFCARDCGAQACTNKLCAPVQVGSAQAAVRWARTSDALYRITGNTPSYGLPSNYIVTRTPLNGSAEVVMHSDAKNPGGLAVDDTYVYWAVNGTPAAVLKKAHNAAAATTPIPVFETSSIPVQMTIRGEYLYYTNLAGAIFRRTMSSASLADDGDEIVSAAEVKGSGTFNLHQDFVTTPTALYWVVLPTSGNLAFIRTAPLAGGTASDVPGAITNSFTKLSVVGEDIYWIRATSSALDGAYHYAPGGDATPLILQANLDAVLAAGDYLYVLEGRDTIYRAPVAGGTTIKIGSSSSLAYALDFAGTDATNVYVHTSFTHGNGFYGDYKLLGYPR